MKQPRGTSGLLEAVADAGDVAHVGAAAAVVVATAAESPDGALLPAGEAAAGAPGPRPLPQIGSGARTRVQGCRHELALLKVYHSN